jgi:hypothetical protein
MLRGKVSARIGVFAGVGACVALLLAAASAQAHTIHIETKSCTGLEEHKVIKGKLTVRPGEGCTLFNDTVDGDVSVGRGARLTTVAATVMKENLSTEGAAFVELVNSEVEGNVSIEATSGTEPPFLCLAGPLSVCMIQDRFGGNVSVINTAPNEAVLAGNLFAQDLTCTGNAFVTNDGSKNTVLGQVFGQCVGL